MSGSFGARLRCLCNTRSRSRSCAWLRPTIVGLMLGVGLALAVVGCGSQTGAGGVSAKQARTTVRVSDVIANRVCYKLGVRGIAPQIACDHGVPRGYALGQTPQRTLLIKLRFVAPLAANGRTSVYEYAMGHTKAAACPEGSGDSVTGTTNTPIDKGKRVVIQDEETPCPGTYEGFISYAARGERNHAHVSWNEPINDGSALVDRFRFSIP